MTDVDFRRVGERQMACLRLQCQGRTKAQVGAALGITRHTVSSHIRIAHRLIFWRETPGARPSVQACYLLGRHDATHGHTSGILRDRPAMQEDPDGPDDTATR